MLCVPSRSRRARSSARTPSSAKTAVQDFWDILVRLDAQVGSGVRKPGKAGGKQAGAGPMHAVELGPDEPLRMMEFASSGLGQLIMMLHSEIFQKMPDLSDRLLRLISSIAVNVHKRDLGVPVLNSAVAKATSRAIIRPGKLTKTREGLGPVESGGHAVLQPGDGGHGPATAAADCRDGGRRL